MWCVLYTSAATIVTETAPAETRRVEANVVHAGHSSPTSRTERKIAPTLPHERADATR